MSKSIKLLGQLVSIDEFQPSKGEPKILIYFKFNQKLLSEFRALEGSKDEGREGGYQVWSFKMTPRNVFSIDILSSGAFYGSSKFYEGGIDLPSNYDLSKYLEDMWAHQQKAFNFKVKRRRCIDAGEMGIGKTLSTLRAIKFFLSLWPDANVWWVAPNSGLTALRTQLDKWYPEGFLPQSQFMRMNYHSLERTMERTADSEIPQTIVFDECHALKNPAARRTQLAMQLTVEMEKRHGLNCAIIGLTGTPAPEDHFDWWSICEVVRPGWLRESSYNKYKWRLAEWGQGERIDGGTYPKFLGWKQTEVELLPKRLEGLVLVTWKKDCLDLPEKVYEERILEPSAEVKRAAKTIVKTSPRAITAQMRCRELSDGFQYSFEECSRCGGQGVFDHSIAGSGPIQNCESCNGNGKREKTLLVPTPKDDALREIQEEYRDNYPHRMVVYAAFEASIDRIVNLLKEEGWNVWRYDGRGQEFRSPQNEYLSGVNGEKTFQNAEEFKVPWAFVGNPEAAGQGLTLTPSPVIVYYSNSFKSQFRVQSEDRIHRPGADKSRGCKIIDLIHLPTDRLILDAVKRKRDIETFTLNEIEKCLE